QEAIGAFLLYLSAERRCEPGLLLRRGVAGPGRTAPGNGQVAAACEDSGSEGHSQPGPSTAFGSGKYTPHAGAAEYVSRRLSERMLLSSASKLNITDLSRAYPG